MCLHYVMIGARNATLRSPWKNSVEKKRIHKIMYNVTLIYNSCSSIMGSSTTEEVRSLIIDNSVSFKT